MLFFGNMKCSSQYPTRFVGVRLRTPTPISVFSRKYWRTPNLCQSRTPCLVQNSLAANSCTLLRRRLNIRNCRRDHRPRVGRTICSVLHACNQETRKRENYDWLVVVSERWNLKDPYRRILREGPRTPHSLRRPHVDSVPQGSVNRTPPKNRWVYGIY